MFRSEEALRFKPKAPTPTRLMQGLGSSTVRVFLDVVNTDPGTSFKVLRPLGAVHAFFRRPRITTRGVVIEDIMDYNKVHEMFDILALPQAQEHN